MGIPFRYSHTSPNHKACQKTKEVLKQFLWIIFLVSKNHGKGIDEFSFKKGHKDFIVILIDLETHPDASGLIYCLIVIKND